MYDKSIKRKADLIFITIQIESIDTHEQDTWLNNFFMHLNLNNYSHL